MTAAGRPPRIYWGGAGGIDPERWSEVPAPAGWTPPDLAETEELSETERVGAVAPLANAVPLSSERLYSSPAGGAVPGAGQPRSQLRGAAEVRVPQRPGGSRRRLRRRRAGRLGVRLPRRRRRAGVQLAVLGRRGRFAESARLAVPTHRACDVALADLSGDGRRRPGDLPAQDGGVVHGRLARVRRRCPRAQSTGAAQDARCPQGCTRPALPMIRCRRWCSSTSSGRRADMAVDSYLYYGGRDGFSPERRARACPAPEPRRR